jgi:hypothetical protein
MAQTGQSLVNNHMRYLRFIVALFLFAAPAWAGDLTGQVGGGSGGGGGAVSSVSGTTGQIVVTPTTGNTVVSLPSTITQNETFSAGIDGSNIGATTPGTGAFTTLTVGGALSSGSVMTVTGSGQVVDYELGTGSGANFQVNYNAAAVATVPHENSIHISGADTQYAAFYIDSYGLIGGVGSTRSIINLRSARGTGASPTATQQWDEFARFAGRAYGATGFSGSVGALSFVAAQNFSDTAQGTFGVIRTTALNTAGGGAWSVPPATIGFTPSGGEVIGTGFFSYNNQVVLLYDPGNGIAEAQTGLGIMGGTTADNLFIETAAGTGNFVLKLPFASFDFTASGGSNQFVKQTSSGGAFSVATIALADISTALTGNLSLGGNVTLNGILTAASLVTSGTITGSICTDASGHIINNASGNCYVAGSGNALFGTTSGNTSGDLVSLSNTTVGVADSGIAATNVDTLSGTQTISGTKTFTTASATLFQASGATGTNASVAISNSTSTGTSVPSAAIDLTTDNGHVGLIEVINSLGTGSSYANTALSTLVQSGPSMTGGLIMIANAGPVIINQGGTNKTTNVAVNIVSAVNVELPNIASSSSAQTGTVCWGTGGTLTYDPTLGCLTSLEELKDIHGDIDGVLALAEVNKLTPFWFTPKNRPEGSDLAEQPGLGAHQVESVDKRLVGYDSHGELRGVRYAEMTAVLIAAIKQQQAEIAELRNRP